MSDAADGTPLANYGWTPARRTQARRGIYLLHGLSEYAGRYEHVAAWLNARGWLVGAHDHRGHGRSGGKRASIDHPEQLIVDAEERIAAFAAELDEPPILLGHSMGGLIATHIGLRNQLELTGLVLCSPAFQIDLKTGTSLLLKLLSRAAPNLQLRHNNYQPILTHDPAITQAYREDPLVNRVITPRLAAFIHQGGPQAIAAAHSLPWPTLLLVAGDDRVVSPAGSRAFANAAAPGRLAVRWYDEAWHELLNEAPALARPVYADLDAWLAQV